MNAVSLSVSGLTISYHQGVVKGLQRRKLIDHRTKFTGTSGGAVTSILTKCKITPDTQHDLTKELLKMVNEKKELKIVSLFYEFLDEYLPENCAELCNNEVTCAMFKLAWPFPSTYTLNEFKSKQELIDATLSSCYIPFFLGDSLTWKFRGQRHVDAGVVKKNMLIQVPNAIHVASMPYEQLHNYSFNTYTNIYMGLSGKLPFDAEIIHESSYAIHEDIEFFCNALFELGYNDAISYNNERGS